MIKKWPFTLWAILALGLTFGMWATGTFGYPRNLFMEFVAPWRPVWGFMFWLPRKLFGRDSSALLTYLPGVLVCFGLDLVIQRATHSFRQITEHTRDQE